MRRESKPEKIKTVKQLQKLKTTVFEMYLCWKETKGVLYVKDKKERNKIWNIV